MAEDAIRFKNEFRDGYNRFFPQRRVRIKKIDLRKPWLDDDTLKEKIKERNGLYALKLKGGIEWVPDGTDHLRSLTLEVGQLRRQLKKSYFAEQLSRALEQARTQRLPVESCMILLGNLAKGLMFHVALSPVMVGYLQETRILQSPFVSFLQT